MIGCTVYRETEEKGLTENKFNELLNWSLSGQRLPFENSPEESWKKILSRISSQQQPEKVHSMHNRSKGWKRLAIAATVAALIGISGYYYFNSRAEEVVKTFADHQLLNLPDGSLIELNANSTISYKTNNWPEERSLKLEGEAYFEVNPGSQFAVETPHGTVIVKGTAFNVYSRVDSFAVSCSEGEVWVNSADNKVVLQAGETIWLRENQLAKAATPDFQPLWRGDVYKFNNAKIAEVFQVLEMQFGIEIHSSAVSDSLRYTGRFSGKELDEALQVVCLPLGLKYTVGEDGKLVTIKP